MIQCTCDTNYFQIYTNSSIKCTPTNIYQYVWHQQHLEHPSLPQVWLKQTQILIRFIYKRVTSFREALLYKNDMQKSVCHKKHAHISTFSRATSPSKGNHKIVPWASCQIRKFAGAHAPGMPGTFSPSPQVSDPDMHHGTCVTHVPWCMPGSLTSGFLWNRRRGKTFPAFPAHAQTAILRIW